MTWGNSCVIRGRELLAQKKKEKRKRRELDEPRELNSALTA
jgi:hypothetical protein